MDKEDHVILTQSFSGDKQCEERPWGNFEILLDTPHTKVKRITVNPNARLSLQYHEHRSEVWTIVNGYGEVQVGDVTRSVKSGGVVEIPTGYKHRVIASEVGITFVEVQLSNSKNFSEDDIIRIEDDYGRV
jgi:mannose-6-phosphate isomerase-like protein (cupin superfamily)